MTTLTHLNWQPVILLRVVRMPFDTFGGLSLQRAYLALRDGRLLYADWTLEADERAVGTTCVTGWTFDALPSLPFRLYGKSAKLVPSGTHGRCRTPTNCSPCTAAPTSHSRIS